MNMERETMSRNLKKLLDQKGVDQRMLADYLGISEMSVSNWVNGLKYPRMGNVQKMADYFGVMKSDIIEEKENKPFVTSGNYTYIPTAISAGLPIKVDAITETNTINLPDSVMGKWAGNKEILITAIYGDSMNRIMPNGSLIAIKPTPIHSLKNGDIVVFSDNGDYSIKYYYKYDDTLVFKPHSTDDSFYDQSYSVNDNIKIHGKVVVYIVEMD